MRSWPWDLADVLRQALGNPGSRAVGAVLTAGLAPGESGAFFLVDADEIRPVAAVPAEAPVGEPAVRALAARAVELVSPVEPGRPFLPSWPAACAVGTGASGDVRGALVVLARDAVDGSGEMRSRAALLAPLLGALVGLDRARRRAHAAEARAGHLERRLGSAERDAVLGRLSSSLAHEIRNPLTVVGATVQYLRDRLPPDHEHRVLLDTADRKVREMDESLENLLSFTRPLDLRPRPVALAALVGEIAAFVRGRAERQGVEVAVDAEPGLPDAAADPRLLERAILNLALNALDAMPTAGRLGFALRRASDGTALVLMVTDTGAGIEPAQLGAIFEPAFSTKRRGAGLGLAIARRIVEEHGGAIEAASEPGRGTTFTVRLPAPAPPAG